MLYNVVRVEASSTTTPNSLFIYIVIKTDALYILSPGCGSI